MTYQGQSVDHATVRVLGMPETETVTDGSGWFGILHVPPGTYTLQAEKPNHPTRTAQATINAAGEVETVNITLDIPASVGEWGLYNAAYATLIPLPGYAIARFHQKKKPEEPKALPAVTTDD